MCGVLDDYCRDNTCRLLCRLQWPGLWVAESTPAVHGILQGYEMPDMTWIMITRHGSSVPDTLVIYQERSGFSGTRLRAPLRCALPLKSDGLAMPQALTECLPPHVAEAVQQRIRSINARLAEEVRELEAGCGHVGETVGRGEEGGVIHGHISNLVGL